MTFQITTTRSFAAAHQLHLYDGSLEPLHGHNWKLKVTVGSNKLDSIGVVMDFHDLDRQVESITSTMHNRHLNDLPPFQKTNPTTENVAIHVANQLKFPPNVTLLSVEVWETDANSAIYQIPIDDDVQDK